MEVYPLPNVNMIVDKNSKKAPTLIDLASPISEIILKVIFCNKRHIIKENIIIDIIWLGSNPLTIVKNNVSMGTKSTKSIVNAVNSGETLILFLNLSIKIPPYSI